VGHIATVFFEALIRTERGRDEIILANNTTGVRKNTTAFQLSTDEREARATEVRALKYRVLEEYPIPIGDEVTFDQKADDWLVDGHPWDQHRQTIVQKWRIPVLDWPFARAALDWSMDRILSRVVRISRVCGTKKTIKRARDAIKRDEKLRYRRDCQVGQPLVDPSDDDSEDDESKTRTQLAKEAERAKKREHRKQQTREKRREQREQEEKENSKGIMGIVENLGMWIRELTQRYTVRTLIQARAWMATQWESMNVPEIDLDGASLAQSNIHMSDIRVFQFMAHLSLYAPGVFVLVHSPLSFAIRKPMMFREIEAHVLAQLSDRLRRPTEEKRTLDQREEKKRETLDQREEKKRETLDQREEKKREALGQRDEEKRETLDGKKRETLDQCDEKTAPKRKRDEPGEEPEATAKRKREDDEPDKHHKATGKRKRGETDDEASERRDKKTNAERRREAPDKQGEKALKRKREDGAPDKHHKHHKVRRDGERGEAPKGGSKWLDNWPTPKYETDDAQRLRPHQLRLKHRLQEKIKRDPQQQGRIIYGEVRFGKMRSAADTIRMMIEELGDAFPRFVIYVVPDKCNVTHAERELRDVCCAPLWGKNIKVSTDTKHGTVHGKRGKTSFKSYHITIITREVFRTHADWLADNGHDIYYVIDEIDSVFTSSTRSEAALRVASTSAFFLGATATMRPTNDNKQIKWLRLLSPQFYVSTKNWKVALCSIDREYYDPGVTAKFVTHEVDEGHDGSFNLELVHANPTILQLAREIVDRRGDVLIWANSKKHLETLFTLLAKAGLKPGRLADILNRERNAILLNSYTDCRGLNGGERFAEAVEVPTASNAATRHQKIGRQIGPAQRSKEVTLHTVAVRGIMNRRLANHDRLDEDNMSVHHGLLFHDDSLPTLEPVAPGGL
jgi:flagellar biosynthesis GTPase FlhF